MTTFTALESYLTPEEQHVFLDRVVARNPHLEGGTVADFLEMMHDTDSDLTDIETFPVPPSVERKDVLADCVRAVKWSHDVFDAGRVLQLYSQVLPAADPPLEGQNLLEDVHFGAPQAAPETEDIADLGGV